MNTTTTTAAAATAAATAAAAAAAAAVPPAPNTIPCKELGGAEITVHRCGSGRIRPRPQLLLPLLLLPQA